MRGATAREMEDRRENRKSWQEKSLQWSKNLRIKEETDKRRMGMSVPAWHM